PKERWLYRKRTYHPLIFKREYMASFDAMSGKALAGDWLHYYTLDELPLKDKSRGVRTDDGALNVANLDLTFYIGIDPTTGVGTDRFAAIVLGVTKDRLRVYMMDVIAARIPFPEQVDMIQDLHLKWRPDYIAIESNNFQVSLSQQAMRLEGMPPILPV